MRIVGGELGGRTIAAPPGRDTRPTSDRVREGIAGALEARDAIADALVLDLFAGSGALGLEALSRGAARVLSIDHDRRALRCIEDNAMQLDVRARLRALKLDLLGNAERCCTRITAIDPGPFGLVFADPPYADVAALSPLLAALARAQLLTQDVFVVIEHARGEAPVAPAAFTACSSYRYGDTEVALWQGAAHARAP